MAKDEVNFLLITENNIGFEFLSAAKSISKIEEKNVKNLSIDWDKSTTEIREEIEKNIETSTLRNKKIIILTESFGDVSCNYTIPYFEKNKIEIITGMNVDMVLKTLNYKKTSGFEDILMELEKSGKKGIKVINKKELKFFDYLLIMGIGTLPYTLTLSKSLNENLMEKTKENIDILNYYTGEEIFEIEEKLMNKIKNLSEKNILILLDCIFSKNFLELLSKISNLHNITIISGVNFPMINFAIRNFDIKKENFLEEILEIGDRNIKIISQLLS